MAKAKPMRINLIYAVLFVITLLVVVAIFISAHKDYEDQQTLSSDAIRSFIQDCQMHGGSAEVPLKSQMIGCRYPNGSTTQYTS